ncbi:MAG: hypothetical protein COB02_06875 [Candidatus Cloacimonadota bacterium]|nr:MAG: hypothetical protein COB02_06875 [Candidatus Cloacimonadota bacterium]
MQKLEAKKFDHFFLREFVVERDSSDVLIDESQVNENSVSQPIFFEREQADFFELQKKLAPVKFEDIRLNEKYYYDSKVRASEKITVLLFGTLWDPDTIENLRIMKDLKAHYSQDRLADKYLVAEFHRWFRSVIKTGTTRKKLDYLLQGGIIERNKLIGLETAHFGAHFYFPSNFFVQAREILNIMKNNKYYSNVAFAFIAISGEESEAHAILKDEKIPFPFLNDYLGDVAAKYVTNRVPLLMIIDPSDEIIYQGEVLGYRRTKANIDRLLLNVYNRISQRQVKANKNRRLMAYQRKLEDDLYRKRQIIAKQEKEAAEKQKATSFRR